MKGFVVMTCVAMMFLCLGCGGEDNSCSVRGSSCGDSDECCGSDICVNYQCVSASLDCAPTDYGCDSNFDCCNFQGGYGYCIDNICKDSCSDNSQCVSFCCAPTSIQGISTCADASYCPSCLPVRSYCTTALECCGSMLCDAIAGTCCSQSGMGCVYDNDCCGAMVCYGGICQ